MEGELKNLVHVWLIIITSLSYCHFISARIPKGKWRLLSILPIFFVFIILPLYLTSVFFISLITFFITWLGNFKLLLFAFDKGPLSSIDSTLKSLPIFIVTTTLAFKIKSKNNAPQKSKILPLNLATEIPLAMMLIKLYDYKEYIHPYVVLTAYIISVFLWEDIFLGVSSLMVHVVFGLEIDPPFDEPYLSTSVREFWGKRWNLPFSSLLHQTIYIPVRPVLGRDLTLLVGFLMSGVMHELLLWCVTRVMPSWQTTIFFLVQGVCVVVELRLKLALDEKTTWRFLSVLLTLGFLAGTSFWLFLPPLIRNGVDVRIIEEFKFVEEFVMKKILEVFM